MKSNNHPPTSCFCFDSIYWLLVCAVAGNNISTTGDEDEDRSGCHPLLLGHPAGKMN